MAEKRIIANIPARAVKSKTGKVFNYASRTEIFVQDEHGQWAFEIHPYLVGEERYLREDDVISVCEKASNWDEIRSEYFPMVHFHAYEEEQK